jgi:hypothetical protein
MDDHPDFGFSGDVATWGGKLVVPTALLNDSIADAGFFVQMALAAITPGGYSEKEASAGCGVTHSIAGNG